MQDSTDRLSVVRSLRGFPLHYNCGPEPGSLCLVLANNGDQSIAQCTHSPVPCAHEPQAQALHMRNGCSRTSTDRAHAPSTQHLHVRNVAQ